MRFKDKVIIVTGAGSGVGRGIAEFLSEEGGLILVNDIRSDAAEETQQLIKRSGGRSQIVIADVSTLEGAIATIDAAISQGGRLDLLVNNAGLQIFKTLDELQSEEWDQILDVNLKAFYLCAKAAARVMTKQSGAIVNISSVHARATIEGFTAYAASKAGILGLTRALAIEYAPHGIRVNAISPGTIDTSLLRKYFDSQPNPSQARTEFLKFHPIGRFGTPRDIAELVAFLGSSAAGFITGTEVIADGGMTACLLRQ